MYTYIIAIAILTIAIIPVAKIIAMHDYYLINELLSPTPTYNYT